MLQEPPPLLPLLSINIFHSVSLCLSVCVADSKTDRQTDSCYIVPCHTQLPHCQSIVQLPPFIVQCLLTGAPLSINQLALSCLMTFDACYQSLAALLQSIVAGSVQRFCWFLVSLLSDLVSEYLQRLFLYQSRPCQLYTVHQGIPFTVALRYDLVCHQSFWRLLTASVTWWMDKWTAANSTVPCDQQHCAVWSTAHKDAVSCHCRL